MKKIKSLVLMAVVALATSFAFADLPAFDLAENAFVFEQKSVKGKAMVDYCQLINFTDDTKTVFDFYGYHKKDGWIKLGTSTVQPYGDSENIESEWNHKLNKFIAYAIVPENGKEYKYTFSKFDINMYVVRHYCGSVKVLPENCVPGKNAFVFENASVKGSFKDNVKVFKDEKSPDLAVKVYGSNDSENWELVAGGTVKKDGSTLEKVDEENTAKFKFYAVEAIGSKKTFEISKAHNDLYITVK